MQEGQRASDEGGQRASGAGGQRTGRRRKVREPGGARRHGESGGGKAESQVVRKVRAPGDAGRPVSQVVLEGQRIRWCGKAKEPGDAGYQNVPQEAVG